MSAWHNPETSKPESGKEVLLFLRGGHLERGCWRAAGKHLWPGSEAYEDHDEDDFYPEGWYDDVPGLESFGPLEDGYLEYWIELPTPESLTA